MHLCRYGAHTLLSLEPHATRLQGRGSDELSLGKGGGRFGWGGRAVWCFAGLPGSILRIHYTCMLIIHGAKYQCRAYCTTRSCRAEQNMHCMQKMQSSIVCCCAGSASGPTTDPVLLQVQQDFMPASGHMQQAGLSPAFFAASHSTLTSKLS